MENISIRDSAKIIYLTDREKKFSQTKIYLKASLSMARETEWANMYGIEESFRFTKVCSNKT